MFFYMLDMLDAFDTAVHHFLFSSSICFSFVHRGFTKCIPILFISDPLLKLLNSLLLACISTELNCIGYNTTIIIIVDSHSTRLDIGPQEFSAPTT